MPDDQKNDANANQNAAAKPADAKPPEQQSSDKPPVGNYVTQEFLKQFNDANARKTRELFDGINIQITTLKDEFSKTIEALKPSQDAQDQDAKKSKAQSVPELIEVKKALEASNKKNLEFEKTISDMQNRERAYRFSTIVRDALNRQGCIKTEEAFRVIRDDLKLEPDGNRVFAIVELEGQQVELDVDKYVETIVKEKRLPEFFSGNHRAGSPASGGTVAGKDFDFTMEQIRDTEFYAANADKIREALSKGRVKMK